jgi:hypothetical protein
MNLDDIRDDIAAFADDEDGVLIERGLILFQKDRQLYSCRLIENTPGSLLIEVNNNPPIPYLRFIAEDLGRLSILAHSIKQKRKDVDPYIDTQAVLFDQLDSIKVKGSAFDILANKCNEHLVGETTLIFLTAEAGEGKTALLRHLSQSRANNYLVNKSNSLLLHIDTQGRSFIRLEEAIARELGQLRISGLFYSGVIRLVKRGLLAIAIDGFDELLAEIGSSEAYSGMGAFLRQLDGTGTIIAAARNAYFQTENYTAQTQLLLKLPDIQVTVNHLQLEKWTKKETVDFFSKYKNEAGQSISSPEGLYDELASLAGPDHIILQRPFLVYTLAQMLSAAPDSARDIIRDIGDSGLQVVPKVIRAFLKREVEEKWRDPTGQPYLSLEQHIHLLAAIADEMWTQLTKTLPVELVQLITESITEELHISIPRRVQIVERVKAHVMLPSNAALRPNFRAFDHDEFLDYFIAVRICEILKSENKDILRRFLERSSLPIMSAKWTAIIEPWGTAQIIKIINALSGIVAAEIRSTYLKQNAGLLSARLAGLIKDLSNLVFDSMYFEGDDWRGTTIFNGKFKDCVFNGVDFSDNKWKGIRFYNCQFQSLIINEFTEFRECIFDEHSRVIGLLRPNESNDPTRIFIPELCERILSDRGALFEKSGSTQLSLEARHVPEEIRSALNAFLRIFTRSSGANEDLIKTKLGPRLSLFKSSILPSLLHYGIIRKAIYRGGGSQDRYELNYPVELILSAEDRESSAPPELNDFWKSMINS